MDDSHKSKSELINELRILRERLSESENKQGFSKEDKFKLAIMNHAPFSAWACNRNFDIVFWSAGTAKIYGRTDKEAIGQNYLDLFVSEEERERSASDCLDVIDNNIEQRNFLAYDQLSNDSKRALLTNCFRIWDKEENDYLQAEVALEVPELAPIIEEHRTLRELGIKRKAEYERILLLERLGNITTLISSSILGNEGPQQVFTGIMNIVNDIIGEQLISGIYLKNMHTWVAESLINANGFFETIKSDIGEYSIANKRVLFIDHENDIPNELPELMEWWKSDSNHSIAILPLVSMEQVVGVWFVAIKKPYKFDEGIRESLRLIANQVAFAVSIARLVQSLQDLNAKIAEKQDLITRSLIAVDFIHRMNNLAGPIQGWTSLITEELDLSTEHDQKIQAYLIEINNEVKQLLKAANSLQEVSKPQNIDIKFMLTAILRNIKIQYTNITVEAKLSSEIYLVRAIYSQLSDAVWNVISNSLDAMPQGGTLILEARNVDDDKKWVEITVKDTGIGIPEEYHSQIFVINYTTKGFGRGYGLWRTRHVIEDLGGRISLAATGTKMGTTFTLLIPAIFE